MIKTITYVITRLQLFNTHLDLANQKEPPQSSAVSHRPLQYKKPCRSPFHSLPDWICCFVPTATCQVCDIYQPSLCVTFKVPQSDQRTIIQTWFLFF